MDAKQWFEVIISFLAALGSLATVGAFIYLFRRDKDKQAQIDKLAGISEALQMQLYQDKDNTRLQFLPSLKLKKRIAASNGSGFIVLVGNHGRPARILMVNHQSEHLDYTPTNKVPFDCTEEIKFEFYYNNSKVPFREMNFAFDIFFSCELNYKYKTTISGDAIDITMSPAKLLTLEEVKSYNLN